MADSKLPRVKPFSWTGGYNVTSPRAIAGIAQRYGSPMTRWLASAPVDNPNLGTGVEAEDQNMLRDAQTKSDADMAAAANTAQREENAAVTEQAGNIRAAAPMIPNLGTQIVQAPTTAGATINPTSATVPGAAGPRGFINPNAGNPAGQSWMDRGGSAATLHAAQAASGIRPAIDARATRSPADLGSDVSADIRAGWGWPDTAMGDTGAQIWDSMTEHFNNSAAAVQNRQDNAARLAAAKAKLAREFGPMIPSTSGRSTGGALDMPEDTTPANPNIVADDYNTD